MAALSTAIREFLAQPHFAVIATIAPDGLPHQTVVWYELQDDTIVFSVPRDTVKHKHLQRDPRISICIEEGFRYVTVVGTAALEEDPDKARALYTHMGERYRGSMQMSPPRPSATASELMSRPRVAIRMTIERVIS
jgi:PPOX class probable F420-dependent enzyme